MPWAPELFSAPVLQRLTEKLHRELVTVPFFEGLMTGELDALVGSFADEPELHHPVRGRIRGVHAFETYVANTQDWLSERAAAIEDVQYISARPHSAGEANLRLGGRSGRVDLPVAIVADRQPDGRISELRMYYSSWPLTGHHAVRPPHPATQSGTPRARVSGQLPACARHR
jgi:hypothetical protein